MKLTKERLCQYPPKARGSFNIRLKNIFLNTSIDTSDYHVIVLLLYHTGSTTHSHQGFLVTQDLILAYDFF